MIALDASVLIAHLDRHDQHHEAAQSLLFEHHDHLCASPITIAEALVGPAVGGTEEHVHTAIRTLGVEDAPWPADAAIRLARLRAATRLKLPDCCVLLAAEASGAHTVLTFDDRLRRAAVEAGFAAP